MPPFGTRGTAALEGPSDERDRERACWRVSGRVQGVGFRYYVLQAARRIGVDGDVRNLADGRVEIRAEAPVGELRRLREAVSRGPAASRVERMEDIGLEDDVHFTGFDVRY